jgi:hypothetical protein
MLGALPKGGSIAVTTSSEAGHDIVAAVREAFADVHLPATTDIVTATSVRDPERDRVRRELDGRHWRDLDAASIASHPEALFLLAPRAWHFYLPAYLITALVAPRESDLAAASVVVSLTPDRPDPDSTTWVGERVRLLSAEQRSALERWLDHLATSRPWELSRDRERRIVDVLRDVAG